MGRETSDEAYVLDLRDETLAARSRPSTSRIGSSSAVFTAASSVRGTTGAATMGCQPTAFGSW
jgi:hypothetical protein